MPVCLPSALPCPVSVSLLPISSLSPSVFLDSGCAPFPCAQGKGEKVCKAFLCFMLCMFRLLNKIKPPVKWVLHFHFPDVEIEAQRFVMTSQVGVDTSLLSIWWFLHSSLNVFHWCAIKAISMATSACFNQSTQSLSPPLSALKMRAARSPPEAQRRE